MDRRTFLIAGSTATAFSAFAQSEPDVLRSALVIGNVTYSPIIGKLRNPANDAIEVAKSLSALGFGIHGGEPLIDADRETLMSSIRSFASKLEKAHPTSVGFLYFSGHGAAHQTRGNHLFPIIDWPEEKGELDDSIWDNAVSVPWLFDVLNASAPPKIVCIDACRNTLVLPSAEKAVSGGGTFSDLRGMGRVEESKKANMYLSFATSEGQTASDGKAPDKNGPYASALVRRLQSKGSKVRDLFEDVRFDVLDLTDLHQEPFSYSQLQRDFNDLTLGESNESVITPAPQTSTSFFQALVFSDEYKTKPEFELAGASKDSELVAEALTASGFDVAVSANPTRHDFLGAIYGLRQKLGSAGPKSVGLIYFNGYGGSRDGDNALIPSDAVGITGSDELFSRVVFVSEIMNVLQTIPNQGIVLILDCATKLLKVDGELTSKGIQSGRGWFEPIAGESSKFLIVYASSPGNHAAKPDGQSLFTRLLVEEMSSDRRQSIQEIMEKVSQDIETETSGKQVPWYQTQFDGPLYFRRAIDAP